MYGDERNAFRAEVRLSESHRVMRHSRVHQVLPACASSNSLCCHFYPLHLSHDVGAPLAYVCSRVLASRAGCNRVHVDSGLRHVVFSQRWPAGRTDPCVAPFWLAFRAVFAAPHGPTSRHVAEWLCFDSPPVSVTSRARCIVRLYAPIDCAARWMVRAQFGVLCCEADAIHFLPLKTRENLQGRLVEVSLEPMPEKSSWNTLSSSPAALLRLQQALQLVA